MEANVQNCALANHDHRSVGQIHVLHHMVLRYAGVSTASFDQLTLGPASGIVGKLVNAEARLLRDKYLLCSTLENVIGSAQTPQLKAELIALKRDIYNDRSPKKELSAEANSALEFLPHEEQRLLKDWLTIRLEREALLREGEAAYANEMATGRKALRRLFLNRQFRRGLALASPSLTYELDQYVSAESEASVRRIRRTERSLIRYYTRTAFKLTPFSTFTRTRLLNIGNRNESSDSRPRCFVKLNRAFVIQIAEWLATHPEISDYVPITCTTSLRKEARSLVALRRKVEFNGSQVRLRIPCESVVAIPSNPVMESLTSCIEFAGSISRRELTTELVKVLPSKDEAAACVDRLIELGILLHKVPIPEDGSSGAEALCRFLASVPSDVAGDIRKALLEMIVLTNQFATAEHIKRSKILAQIDKLSADICSFAHSEYVPNWSGKVVYEDCIHDGISTATPPKYLWPVLSDLEQFLSSCSVLLDDNIFHKRTVRHILENQLGGGPVPFLRFAHHWIQALSGRWQSPETPLSCRELNPLDLKYLRQLMELRVELGSVIAESSEKEEIDLRELAQSKLWEEKLQSFEPRSGSALPRWFSCYGQPLAGPSGNAGLVINNLFAGPCRLLMHSLSNVRDIQRRSAVIRELRLAFEQMYRPFEPCQLLASLDYNGNLVPRLTRRVINYADDCSIPAADAVGLGDLDVVLEDGDAALVHRSSRKRLIPLDFGMLASSLQPPIYRLLDLLGGITDPPIRCFEPMLWRGAKPSPADGAETFPRLRYGACILRRRGWSVPIAALPSRQRKESDFQYMLRVGRWQHGLGCPDEVFVRGTSLLEWRDQAQRKLDRQTWNRRKPQYIHFRNPFLISIFEKAIQETANHLYIEEMLPGRDSWTAWGLKRPFEVVFDIGVTESSDRFRRMTGAEEFAIGASVSSAAWSRQ